MKDDIKQRFADAIGATGLQLENAASDVAVYAALRAAHVAAVAAANEPNLAQVIADEQHRVWLYAAGRAVRSGDAADAQAFGLIQGLLLGAAGA